MSSIGTGYDLSVTTFSPDGRVFQIEYAAKAVDNSGYVHLLQALSRFLPRYLCWFTIMKIFFYSWTILFSRTVIGIKCKDGIVVVKCPSEYMYLSNFVLSTYWIWWWFMEGQGVEKLIASKMMLPGSNRRIHSVHRHAGMVLFHFFHTNIYLFVCLQDEV